MKELNRISIIGGSGTGKTTLANNLSKELGIPAFHIDAAHHLENWKIRDKDERDKLILDKVNESKWIIDGTYKSTLETRLKNADKIIYLDYSTYAQVKGVMGRFFKNHGKEKPEIPGCREKIDTKFLRQVVRFRKEKRPEIMKQITKIDTDKILIFKSRRMLNKWFKMEFNRNIEV